MHQHLKAIRNVDVVTENEVLKDQVVVYGDHIEAIMDSCSFEGSPWRDACETIDAEDISEDNGRLIMSPGLVDIHIHGYMGVDVMDGNSEALRTISDQVVKNGVTSFLATTMTMGWKQIEGALLNVREWMQNRNAYGAEILGVHLEGPFISETFKGAQDPAYIIRPDFTLIEPWLDVIRLVTFAPETENADAFIEAARKYNEACRDQSDAIRHYSKLALSIGHSAATYEIALSAFKNGVSHITHCFNAMSPLHHRAPGVVGAALAWPFTTEVICDGVHVSPEFFQGLINIKGKDRLVLVTDCMCAGGLGDGEYVLGGQSVVVTDGAPRLENGALAGSVLKMDQGIRNLKKHTDSDPVALAAIGSLNPARVIGVDERKGSLAVGKDADFYIHTDAYDVVMTAVKGRIVHENQNYREL